MTECASPREAAAFIKANPDLAREVARQINARHLDSQLGGLTARQRELLEFIRGYVSRHGICPTFREMTVCKGMSSMSTVSRIVDALESRGFIKRVPGFARTIRLVAS